MRLAGRLLPGGGLALCLATFAGRVWLDAYACGCTDLRLRWEGAEALSLFIPPFALGCLLAAMGAALRIGSRPQRR